MHRRQLGQQAHAISGITFRMRWLGHLLNAGIVLSVANTRPVLPLSVALALFLATLWPPLAYRRSSRAANGKAAELSNLMVDTCLLGIVEAGVGFSLLPTMCAFLGMNTGIASVAGARAAATRMTGFLAFGVATLALAGIPLHLDSSPLTAGVCVLGLLAYTTSLGVTAHTLARKMNHALWRVREQNVEIESQRHALEQAQAATATALVAAELANQAKSRFLAAASHDLRQPLQALTLFMYQLNHEPLSARGARALAAMRSSAQSLLQLFNAVLDVSRLEAGGVVPAPQPCAVADLWSKLDTEFRIQVERKGLSLRFVPCRLHIDSDPVLLTNVLRNFLSNALRYTAGGGIVVGARRRGAELSLQVWDSGCGIPAAAQGRIFDEFVQVSSSEDGAGAVESPGLGLGLSIVRLTAKLLGHTLTVKSAPGRGSMFGIAVRRCDAGSAPQAAWPLDENVMPEQCRAFAPQLAGRRILIVDDDAHTRTALGMLLRQFDCRVATAGTVGGAVTACQAFGRPDLLILDFRLAAGETGLTAIERLQDEFNVDLPAIFVTGETNAAALEGIDGLRYPILHKPVEFALLARTSADLLGAA